MPRINSYDYDSQTYNLDPLFAAETEKSEQEQLYHLVQLDLPEDPVTHITEKPFKVVDANHDVIFGWTGNEKTKGDYLFSKFPVKFSPAEVNVDGSISKASIVIANVSREIMYYIEHYNGLRGCRVHIKTVYANALYYTYTFNATGAVHEDINLSHNPAACLHDEYTIDNYTATELTVTFQLDPIIDLEIRVPRRRYMLDSCYWVFKDADTCGYLGTDQACGKILADCKVKGNQSRFGGFPGISGSRKIYL